MDKVLSARDAGLSENSLDGRVVHDGDSLSVDLTEPSLVDEVLDGLSGRVSVSDERLDLSDHVDGGLVKLDEDGVVDLSESKELEDLLSLGVDLVNTSDSDDDGDLGLGLDIDGSISLGLSLLLDDGSLGVVVLIVVLLGLLLSISSLLFSVGLGLNGGLGGSLGVFGISFNLLLV